MKARLECRPAKPLTLVLSGLRVSRPGETSFAFSGQTLRTRPARNTCQSTSPCRSGSTTGPKVAPSPTFTMPVARSCDAHPADDPVDRCAGIRQASMPSGTKGSSLTGCTVSGPRRHDPQLSRILCSGLQFQGGQSPHESKCALQSIPAKRTHRLRSQACDVLRMRRPDGAAAPYDASMRRTHARLACT